MKYVNTVMQDKSAWVRIVEDEPAIRKLLITLVQSIGYSARSYESAEQFMSEDRLTDPGCVLVDLGLKDMSGTDLIAWIHQQPAPLPTIVVSGRGSIQSAVECLKKGAVDFIEKPVDPARLLAVVGDAVARDASGRAASQQLAETRLRYSRLSAREQQVLSFLAEGLSTKQIAARLELSSKTVEHHRAHVMQKMQSNSLAEVVKAFVSLGLN